MAQHSASLAVGGGNCRRFRWIGCLVAGGGMLAGCNLTGTPQLTLGGSERSKPTVNDLVDHIACEVFQAIKAHTIDPLYSRSSTPEFAKFKKSETADQRLWLKLIENNFVAAVSFQLQVTNTEGINPSLNFINPFLPVATSGVGNVGAGTPFAGNFTLAVNGQLDGSQDRSFTFNYNLPMATLYRYFEDPENELVSPDGQKKYIYRTADKQLQFDCQSGFGLGGDLGLEEIIANGLSATDRTAFFNLYSAPTDSLASDKKALATRTNPSPPMLAMAAFSGPAKIAAETAAAAGAAAGSALAGSAMPGITPMASSATFRSQLDFIVTEGISGGPGWTLRHFTGPNGTAGGGARSGGGGGRGGGGGEGGGRGGGGNQGFLNFSRHAVDTISIQAGPTCRNALPQAEGNEDEAEKHRHLRRDYWSLIPDCKTKEGETARAAMMLQNRNENAFSLIFRTPAP